LFYICIAESSIINLFSSILGITSVIQQPNLEDFLFMPYKNKIIGIYKIINPIGEIYVGQSKNILSRWSSYRNNRCKNQRLIFQSLQEYGFKNHIFEIIEECSIEDLNERERYWQEFYDTLNVGLNCCYSSTNILPSVLSDDSRKKYSEVKLGSKNPFFEKTHNEETRNIISKLFKGVKRPCGWRERGDNGRAKLVVDLQTGIFFDCCKDAAEAYNIKWSTLRGWLNGKDKNKTNLIYVDKLQSP